MVSNARAVGARTASTAGRSPWRDALVAWSFALPFLILFLVFMAGPILVALVTSFTDLRVTDIRNPLSVNFVGIDQATGKYIYSTRNPDDFTTRQTRGESQWAMQVTLRYEF